MASAGSQGARASDDPRLSEPSEYDTMDTRREVINIHARTNEAIESRNADLAERRMRQHIGGTHARAVVALLSRRDTHHRWAVTEASQHAPLWTTCEAAVSEAFHLLEPRRRLPCAYD